MPASPTQRSLKSKLVLHARRRLVLKGQSYRGYFRYRCLFVHVPKTAGKAVTQCLFGHNIGQHLTIEELYDIFENVYGVRGARSWFRFAFVRNPWDRCYSAYRYFSTGGGNAGDAAFAERAVKPHGDFRGFVKNHIASERGTMQIHLRPQAEYVCDASGALALDDIARFETINDDFERIRAKLGNGTPVGEPLKPVNTSKITGDYRTAYDDESAEIIGRAYAQDVRLFGYGFDPTPA
ncbi:MAG: sulfotransferase family 2 domain-containing protein [Planctomycetota bacterium]